MGVVIILSHKSGLKFESDIEKILSYDEICIELSGAHTNRSQLSFTVDGEYKSFSPKFVEDSVITIIQLKQ